MSLSRPATAQPRPRSIARWLLAVALVVLLMVVVGGITRLTESGLSMTRWEPISGTIPPLNQQQWDAEFTRYQATPEYQEVNRGMTLPQFKRIFFWEYLHRLIGRTIGLIFALPLLWFWWKRAIPRGYGWRLTALLALGGMQGAIGWWMVASGLVDRPDVSHFRLATHLIAALTIFAGLIWTALDLRCGARARLTGLSILAIVVLGIQIMLGAFTAGLDAGFMFAEWPLMAGQFFPAGGWNAAIGVLANIGSNPIVVQFIHRWFAWIAAAALLTLAWTVQRSGIKGPAHAIATLVAVQIALGIATLLTGVRIEVAVAHQFTACLLLAATIWGAHGIGSTRA